ncbi:Tat pathway signal sequence domain protein [Dyadobacter chenwenxiniae]|uniref:Tat pathway signal sequence domain protein n=1 Tax=Dyadobacter chenwenxiniae TaxID=2906456 RepID=A0A9X1PMR5_9BACT|nr:Tat pathway signal sequence domain protein [Dyadobacter chenwenxiniae]MCF0062819.1 Tat pathway signal sequence domain protein [Dyadobacter chenwenxiniae]UON85006.1 Tat pathway signal sequence domain protein [Dyadobacter chenwenxiniae]
MKKITRRKFVQDSVLTAAGIPLLGAIKPSSNAKNAAVSVPLHWLDKPTYANGVTFGVPWPKGALKKDAGLALISGSIEKPVQSWPLAYWPDGSLKWTAHALSPLAISAEEVKLQAATIKKAPAKPLIEETNSHIKVNTGKLQCVIEKNGSTIFESLSAAGKETAKNARLVLLVQTQDSDDEISDFQLSRLEGKIEKVIVEQNGPVRAVVKLEGSHADSSRQLLPYIVRLYFYAESDSVRLMHTIIYDADESKDFMRGLGVRFDVPFQGTELHNRHVRFVGENGGVFAESVRGLTGLRRDPGQAFTQAQITGNPTPINAELPQTVAQRLQYIPAFGSYTLFQPTPDAFEIQKQTRQGHARLQSAYGKRSAGTGYLGSPAGGVAFGIRNFWQSHPAQLDIRKAEQEKGEVTLWLWAPRSQPMDLRFYHDGMGQDTYAEQLEGLEITYEDYEPEFGRPYGVARTSEMLILALPHTPSNAALAEIADQIQSPSMLLPMPDYLAASGVFGNAFSLPDTSSEKKAAIEKQLDFYFDYYKNQIEARHWYGFWNYGDFMHAYDTDRHVWKYDVGGFAWDNSELSTDIWLWYYFLRSGRSDAFRIAEAMTRHTGEVDVHHIGPFAPLGSRHNVMHWGCSAKQLRISTATNRRFYYYLTGDERTGDLMREQINAVKTLQTVVPVRKVNAAAPKNTENSDIATVSFGTDWGAIAGAWLTEWERTQDKAIREKLLNSMRTIAAQPHGFFTGSSLLNLKTGAFEIDKTGKVSVSHLNAVFGLSEICFELLGLVDDPKFAKAWLDYCRLYNATPEEQKQELGESLKKLNLQQGHARLTAFAAKQHNDPKLGQRAWEEFYKSQGGTRSTRLEITHLKGPEVLNPIDENPNVSTNGAAQWSLGAIQCLAFAGLYLNE